MVLVNIDDYLITSSCAILCTGTRWYNYDTQPTVSHLPHVAQGKSCLFSLTQMTADPNRTRGLRYCGT